MQVWIAAVAGSLAMTVFKDINFCLAQCLRTQSGVTVINIFIAVPEQETKIKSMFVGDGVPDIP